MKKLITFFILLSLIILTVSCSSDYKTASFLNTEFKIPVEATQDDHGTVIFPSGGVMLPLVNTITNTDETLNYLSIIDIYSQKTVTFEDYLKSFRKNGIEGTVIRTYYDDLQIIKYEFFTHDNTLITFIFAQKSIISSDFQKEINTVMRSIKDTSK